MEIIIVTIILIGALFLVIRPFFDKRQTWDTEAIEDDLDDVTLTGIYATINELDMEYEMGKLSEQDYQHMKQKYEALAIEELRSQEQANANLQVAPGDDFEAQIERELEEMRKAREGS